MKDARTIISMWPNAEAFGQDLGLKTYSHGRLMKMRNSIPPRHWPNVLMAAEKRGIRLSQGDLAMAYHGKTASTDFLDKEPEQRTPRSEYGAE